MKTVIGIGPGGSSRNVSKVDTLVLAERYIKKLQEEESELSGANKELMDGVQELKDEWLKMGGVVLP